MSSPSPSRSPPPSDADMIFNLSSDDYHDTKRKSFSSAGIDHEPDDSLIQIPSLRPLQRRRLMSGPRDEVVSDGEDNERDGESSTSESTSVPNPTSTPILSPQNIPVRINTPVSPARGFNRPTNTIPRTIGSLFSPTRSERESFYRIVNPDVASIRYKTLIFSCFDTVIAGPLAGFSPTASTSFLNFSHFVIPFVRHIFITSMDCVYPVRSSTFNNLPAGFIRPLRILFDYGEIQRDSDWLNDNMNYWLKYFWPKKIVLKRAASILYWIPRKESMAWNRVEQVEIRIDGDYLEGLHERDNFVPPIGNVLPNLRKVIIKLDIYHNFYGDREGGWSLFTALYLLLTVVNDFTIVQVELGGYLYEPTELDGHEAMNAFRRMVGYGGCYINRRQVIEEMIEAFVPDLGYARGMAIVNRLKLL
ncbi:hypothetical protein M231_05230 [Tremella mesenterica]|uniref:Uncharacterized protein n=1 Tax=Tremella mesenterica TaxID=5217 RepID=A0A4Q1BIL0_TREME|nr:hypothetical protein M231_05230 [Tremella mesenterica]